MFMSEKIFNSNKNVLIETICNRNENVYDCNAI